MIRLSHEQVDAIEALLVRRRAAVVNGLLAEAWPLVVDRLKERVINFPDAGQYRIFSRQNPAFAAPLAVKDGKMSGGLRIDQPEKFWEPSKFLIIVKG